MSEITLVTEPTLVAMAETRLIPDGIAALKKWVADYRPECLPDEGDEGALGGLLPHDGLEAVDARAQYQGGWAGRRGADGQWLRQLTDAEMLVELAGRGCYLSYGVKAGRKTNREYIENTQTKYEIPHASIMYHPKMTFFIAGVSRRVSHELIRNYVGADRDEEGSPSQESTRYTHHPGHFVVHPRILSNDESVESYRQAMQDAYNQYLAYIDCEIAAHQSENGKPPKGIARKRIYESASSYLPHSCATSWMWTTNPIALAKLIHERANEAADLEFQRLAKIWRKIVVERYPNLFPQPWMREG